LLSVTVNCHVLTLQGLDDKIGDNTTIIRIHCFLGVSGSKDFFKK
jgi:hypothetical protein